MSSIDFSEATALVEVAVEDLSQAMQDGQEDALSKAVRRLTRHFRSDIDQLLPILTSLLAQYHSERSALRSALEKKTELLKSLMGAPRRVAAILGLVREENDEGVEETWAVIDGPTRQAVRFKTGLDPRDVCPDDDPDEPVWCWLIEAGPDDVVVAGGIDAPALLVQTTGLEREMEYEGEDE